MSPNFCYTSVTMLLRYIERLRQAPEAKRQSHAIVIAAAVTGLVGAAWLSTLPAAVSEVSEVAEETPRPLASFFSRAREQFASLSVRDDGETGAAASSSDVAQSRSLAIPGAIVLSPEELAAARASSSIPYAPRATTTGRVVLIATSTATTTQPR